LAGKKQKHLIFENNQHSLVYKNVITFVIVFFLQTQYFTTIVTQAKQRWLPKKSRVQPSGSKN